MDRRTLLKVGGMAAFGLGVSGCSTRSALLPASRPRVSLPTVKASWERVIRTTVGLRPFRPTGFRLQGTKLDDRLLIHNYGHGGAGHSLSWGCGAVVADLALAQEGRRAAVVGCGIVGLASALGLVSKGL